MLRRILRSLVLLSLTNTGLSLGQQPAHPEPGPAELKELVRRAGISVSEYKTGFKDLTAEEEQKVEAYDQQGKLEKQRRITSDLVIYQSQLDPTQMVEYRVVKSVDGVAIKKREARLVSLLNRSAKADSVTKELDRIYRESRRYDLEHSFYGMTLNQGLPLDERARESFQFTLAGREQVNGHDAVVLDYQQVSQSPHITFNLSSLPPPLKGAEAFYRGRLWLDAETAQLRREVREMTLRLPSLSHPLVLYRFDLDYTDSRFGFLTPRRIVVTIYSRGRTGADKKPELLLGGKVTFEYGAFRRFDVEVPDASLNPPVKP
jgi:Sec-independent protein translocase protein TatA